jgi:hypothetical protein
VHSSSSATGTVSVDGTANAGDTATVNIEDRSYTYTVQKDDTLETIRDRLIDLINQDPKVTASAAGLFDRIRLKARIEGPDGNGIVYTASANAGGEVIMTATTPALCCANVAGARITPDNPARPGETIIVYATGLGLPNPLDATTVMTGTKFHGGVNQPINFVSSLAGGKTANVLYAGLAQNQIGVYEVDLELNSGLNTDMLTQLTIAQDTFVSNIVTIPVINPNAVAPDLVQAVKPLEEPEPAAETKKAGKQKPAKGAKPSAKAKAVKGKKAPAGKPREGTHKAEVIAITLQRKGDTTLEEIVKAHGLAAALCRRPDYADLCR